MGARAALAVAAPRPDRHALFNLWQRDFPRVPRPYAALGAPHGLASAEVIALLRTGLACGEVSRVGAVFGVGSGGSGLLCAMQVPGAQLEAVAARVSAEPAVTHNYAREHAWNLWFVVTGPDPAHLETTVQRLEAATQLRALRLPMLRAYRIALDFDLYDPARAGSAAEVAAPVEPAARPLAARLEAGLPLVERPYEALGAPLGLDEAAVLEVIGRWCERGTVRRLGLVLRHHEFGIAANAMTVFAVPPAQADEAGRRLAAQPGVTLCYRRQPAPGWPFTLYCMVHGRERAAVRAAVHRAAAAAGLAGVAHAVLFSTRRFKQTGSRYFAGDTLPSDALPAPARAGRDGGRTASSPR